MSTHLHAEMIRCDMVSRTQSTEEQNRFKTRLIHASLETAIVLAKVALESDDERAVIRTRQKACEAYEEGLYCLRTAVLTQIELEAIRTKIAHLDSVLMASGEAR